LWARSSAGEHYVDIVGVTGSIPVAPTIFQALSCTPTPAKCLWAALGQQLTVSKFALYFFGVRATRSVVGVQSRPNTSFHVTRAASRAASAIAKVCPR